MNTTLNNEKGAVLVVALLFLTVLLMLMAVLNKDAIYEIMFSRNYQDSQQAFYAAEAGVRSGHGWLSNQGVAPENSIAPPPWFANNTTSALPASAGKWTGYTPLGNYRYRYYVQHLKDENASYAGNESAKTGTTMGGGRIRYYRVTSEGSNGDNSIKRVVQTVITAKY